MMSKKTKLLESQLAQVTQSNDALRAQLSRAEENAAALSRELEEKNNRAQELEARLLHSQSRLEAVTGELNSKKGDLAGANRKLDEYRLRQDAIVSALTEAHATRDRIISEAEAEAGRIRSSAAEAKEAMLAAARESAERIRNEADEILRQARAEAEKIQTEALEEAASLTEAAEAEAKSMIEEADGAVNARKEQLRALNSELSARAAMALEQTELYASMLRLIAEAEELQYDELPEDCDYDCENCKDKCDSYIPETASDEEQEKPEDECDPCYTPPCGKRSTCCHEQAEACHENPEAADTIIDEPIADPEGDEEQSETEPDSEVITSPCDERPIIKTVAEGGDVGAFMRNLYSLEGREAPDDEVLITDVGEGTPLVLDSDDCSDNPENGSSPIPVDADLAEILNDIL